MTFQDWVNIDPTKQLPVVPESTYKGRKIPSSQFIREYVTMEYAEGERPVAMFGSAVFRAAKYKTKNAYSQAVLERYLRMKRIALLTYADLSPISDLVSSKRRGSRHNFSMALESLGVNNLGDCYLTNIYGKRTLVSNESMSEIKRLRKLIDQLGEL